MGNRIPLVEEIRNNTLVFYPNGFRKAIQIKEKMSIEQIKELLKAYAECEAVTRLINDAGSLIYADADCQLLSDAEDAIFNALSDGLSDESTEEVWNCMKKKNAERIYEIRRSEGAA